MVMLKIVCEANISVGKGYRGKGTFDILKIVDHREISNE